MNYGSKFVMRVGRIRLLLVLMILSLGLWLVFAKLVVPPVIERAYRGESWSFLNGMIRGQAESSVSDYLQKWDKATIYGLLSGLGFWLIVLVISSPAPIQRVAAFYKVVAILTLNTLVLFACLEVAAMGVFKIWSSVVSNPAETEGGPREKAPYYASQKWSAQYWHEFLLTRRQQYRPYVLWRRAPFKGKTINIDQHGIRLTPGADCSANSYKVFALGGSQLWGTGAPDWGTIPAYLQAGLQSRIGKPVCMVNYGESAYVSTQGVIELLMQLESGNVPDLVILYGGGNDVYAAYQTGRAMAHQNLDQIAARFVGKERTFVDWLETSYTFLLFKRLAIRLRPHPQNGPKLVTYETMGIDVATLSDSVVQASLANHRIVAAVARAYGFKYFYFWEPMILVGAKPLASHEKYMKHRVEADPALASLYDSVYRTIERRASEYEDLYYLGHIFDEYDSELWIDDHHPSPVGYQLIAQKILDVITARNEGQK